MKRGWEWVRARAAASARACDAPDPGFCPVQGGGALLSACAEAQSSGALLGARPKAAGRAEGAGGLRVFRATSKLVKSEVV
jgi:hypothetical protein